MKARKSGGKKPKKKRPTMKQTFEKAFKVISLGASLFGILVSLFIIVVSMSLPGIIKPAAISQITSVKSELLATKGVVNSTENSLLSLKNITENIPAQNMSDAITSKAIATVVKKANIDKTASSMQDLSGALDKHINEVDNLKNVVVKSIDNLSLVLLLLGIGMFLLFSSNFIVIIGEII